MLRMFAQSMSRLVTILLRALRSGSRAVVDGFTVLGVAFYGGWAVGAGIQRNPAPPDDISIIRESARGIAEIESMLRGHSDSSSTPPPLPSQRRHDPPPAPGDTL